MPLQRCVKALFLPRSQPEKIGILGPKKMLSHYAVGALESENPKIVTVRLSGIEPSK